MKLKHLFLTYCFSLFSLMSFAQVTEYTVTTTGEKIKIDPNPDSAISTASCNYTESGRTIVNNQATYFGWFLYPSVIETVQARLTLWDGNQLVQMTDAYEFKISSERNNGRRIPFYISAPAGTYKVKPLLRQLNKDFWTIPLDYSNYADNYQDMLSYKNWEYNIEDINTHKAPGILMLCSESLSDELVGGNGIPTLFNLPEERHRYERFDAFVRFSNKSNSAKKGKVKLMWSRDFKLCWLGYSFSVDVTTNWSDCITKGATMNGFTDWEGEGLLVEIPANTKDIRFDIKGCYASTYHYWATSYTDLTNLHNHSNSCKML